MKQKKLTETADLRFRGSLPLQKYRKLTIGIAGLGAIGRQAATLLAMMGHKKLYGADFDKVEVKNIGTQGWSYKDIGRYKSDILAEALTTRCSRFIGYPFKFEQCANGHKKETDVFFCCVDNMAARHNIWSQILNIKTAWRGLYIDARMVPGVIRIITIDPSIPEAKDYYYQTLYTDEEAFGDSCTDRMTMFGAYIAAGLMVSQLVNWLNGVPFIKDFLLETQRMTSTDLSLKPSRKKKR